MYPGIYIYDWREGEPPAGIAVAFENDEEKCCCYSVGSNLSWAQSWDVSIAQDWYDLSGEQSRELQHMLAAHIPFLVKMRKDLGIACRN